MVAAPVEEGGDKHWGITYLSPSEAKENEMQVGDVVYCMTKKSTK